MLQAYNTGDEAYPMTNLAILNNTVMDGVLLNGAFNGPTPQSWTGFEIDGNILGDNSIAAYGGGNNVALWTNNIDSDLVYGTLTAWRSLTDSSGTSGPVDVFPTTDQFYLESNTTTGDLYVNIDPSDPAINRFPSTLAAYPVGYTVTFFAVQDSNWVLPADPAWNTFTANQAVTVGNPVTLQVNSQGLFTLIPTLSGIESTALACTENEPATPITLTLAIGDPNSTTLLGATVQISGNYQSGEDVLSFTNTGNITGSWNAATGTLTLSGSDTLADYQAALQSVQYLNTSDDPSTATRIVSFQVNDGQTESNVAVRQITVTPADTLTGIESAPLAYTAGEPATPVTAALTVSDVNSTTLAGATVWISSNYRDGEDAPLLHQHGRHYGKLERGHGDPDPQRR